MPRKTEATLGSSYKEVVLGRSTENLCQTGKLKMLRGNLLSKSISFRKAACPHGKPSSVEWIPVEDFSINVLNYQQKHGWSGMFATFTFCQFIVQNLKCEIYALHNVLKKIPKMESKCSICIMYTIMLNPTLCNASPLMGLKMKCPKITTCCSL